MDTSEFMAGQISLIHVSRAATKLFTVVPGQLARLLAWPTVNNFG
jgi:hypothetical protein